MTRFIVTKILIYLESFTVLTDLANLLPVLAAALVVQCKKTSKLYIVTVLAISLTTK